MIKSMHILIIAGEISSDNHGYKLIKELKRYSDLKISAIGGDKMSQVADFFEENIVSKAVVGIVEILKHIRYFINLKNRIVDKYFKEISNDRIDAIVLIDYPGFNIRIAKIAYKMKIPVFYYITPQVWAWGKKRAGLLAGICRKLFCVFDFEIQLFAEKGGRAEFVGHPMLEDIPREFNIGKFNSKHNITNDRPLLALLPGSRLNEIEKHLQIMLDAVKDIDCEYMLGLSPSVSEEFIREHYGDIKITRDIYTLMKRSDIAVVSSGTSTLETAVIGTPLITIYKVSYISYMIAKLLIKIKYISMVNILAKKELVPELIQNNFNSKNLKKCLIKLIRSNELKENMKYGLNEIAKKLGSAETSKITAESIINELSDKRRNA